MPGGPVFCPSATDRKALYSAFRPADGGCAAGGRRYLSPELPAVWIFYKEVYTFQYNFARLELGKIYDQTKQIRQMK
jgi:hypothetical protein